MSEPQALRIVIITSRLLVTVETDWQNGQLVVVRRPIALKPVWRVRRELERALKGMGGPVAVRSLSRATTVAVQTALLDSYDVVHFVGHGADAGRGKRSPQAYSRERKMTARVERGLMTSST